MPSACHDGEAPARPERPPRRLGLDNYIRLCPTDVNWQPERGAAEAAAAYVAGLFSGPAGDVEEVKCEFYEQATLIDVGENTERVICPHCGAGALIDWFWDLIEENGGSIGNPQVVVPCCGVTLALSALGYDWPVGFARFEVCAMNPARGKYELDAGELARVASLLGHPVLQILARYQTDTRHPEGSSRTYCRDIPLWLGC